MRLIDAEKMTIRLSEECHQTKKKNCQDVDMNTLNAMTDIIHNFIQNFIDETETENVEIVPRGVWIYHGTILFCSNCNKAGGKIPAPYCANCGAKMNERICEINTHLKS